MRTMYPLSEIHEDYNFLMGYWVGRKKKWYCGIEGVYHIYMGDWNDPLIGYKEYAFNEPWFTDGLYSEYAEEANSKGEKDTCDGFAEWLRENAYLLTEMLDEAIYSYERKKEVA